MRGLYGTINLVNFCNPGRSVLCSNNSQLLPTVISCICETSKLRRECLSKLLNRFCLESFMKPGVNSFFSTLACFQNLKSRHKFLFSRAEKKTLHNPASERLDALHLWFPAACLDDTWVVGWGLEFKCFGIVHPESDWKHVCAD